MSRIIGGLILVAGGVVAAVYGWQRVNSLSSELGKLFGNPDTAGIVMIGGGIVAAIIGVVLIVRRF